MLQFQVRRESFQAPGCLECPTATIGVWQVQLTQEQSGPLCSHPDSDSRSWCYSTGLPIKTQEGLRRGQTSSKRQPSTALLKSLILLTKWIGINRWNVSRQPLAPVSQASPEQFHTDPRHFEPCRGRDFLKIPFHDSLALRNMKPLPALKWTLAPSGCIRFLSLNPRKTDWSFPNVYHLAQWD